MKLNKIIYSFAIIFIINSISLYSKNIEEIVVTGTKNKTPIIDETGNLSFINNEEINFISPDNPSNVLNRMPGIFISQGSGQEHLTSNTISGLVWWCRSWKFLVSRRWHSS